MIDNNTTESGPSPAGEGAPAKSKAIAPLSFRPKEGPMNDFMQDLILKFGKAQKALEFCVERAMLPTYEESHPATEIELRKIIAKLEAELLKLNASAVPVTEIQFSPEQEAFIQKIITKKKTNREEAIKFCVLYTKENKLWI